MLNPRKYAMDDDGMYLSYQMKWHIIHSQIYNIVMDWWFMNLPLMLGISGMGIITSIAYDRGLRSVTQQSLVRSLTLIIHSFLIY